MIISFGHSHKLKTLWKNGKLPTVTHGLYGGELSLTNISLEHIKPKSKGGVSALNNFALATVQNNQTRSNNALTSFLTSEMLSKYLKQFEDIKLNNFDGKKYIELIKKTCQKEGLDIIG